MLPPMCFLFIPLDSGEVTETAKRLPLMQLGLCSVVGYQHTENNTLTFKCTRYALELRENHQRLLGIALSTDHLEQDHRSFWS